MADEAKKTKEMRIMRDRWDENGNRIPAGTVEKFTPDEAIAGAESGVLQSIKKGEADA